MNINIGVSDLTNIIKTAISMELRVENTEVKSMVNMMEGLGFQAKNSWAAIHVPNHTVIEFWRKELIKSSSAKE